MVFEDQETFSYEWAKIKSDIMAVAKGIGSGFPLGACLSTEKACISMKQGSHDLLMGKLPAMSRFRGIENNFKGKIFEKC